MRVKGLGAVFVTTSTFFRLCRSRTTTRRLRANRWHSCTAETQGCSARKSRQLCFPLKTRGRCRGSHARIRQPIGDSAQVLDGDQDIVSVLWTIPALAARVALSNSLTRYRLRQGVYARPLRLAGSAIVMCLAGSV